MHFTKFILQVNFAPVFFSLTPVMSNIRILGSTPAFSGEAGGELIALSLLGVEGATLCG